MIRFVKSMRFMVPLLGLTLLQSCALLRAKSAPPDRSATPDAKFKIAGTIVSSLSGTPLGNARVSVFDTSNPADAVWMITSENGRFEFKAPILGGDHPHCVGRIRSIEDRNASIPERRPAE